MLHKRTAAAGIKEGNLCLRGKYITAVLGEDTRIVEPAGVYSLDILAWFCLGRKYSRIKAGGRFRAPGQRTPPRRAGRGLSIGGRNSRFLL